MAESEARKRSREAKNQAAPAKPKETPPLQVSLLGHEVVLDPFSLTIAEKQTWRRYCANLGEHADEADHMMALATVLIQRHSDLTWDDAKDQITWQMLLDAVKAGRPAEADHPQP